MSTVKHVLSETMEKDIRNTSQTMCPRCGYDLRGQVDAWHPGFGAPTDRGEWDVREEDVGAKCPVGGVCSECGLVFEWVNVFYPLRTFAGVFELDNVHRGRSLRKTIFRALLGKPLWKTLAMHHPMNVWRMSLVAAICLVIPLFISAISSLIVNGFPYSIRYIGGQGIVFVNKYTPWPGRMGRFRDLLWFLPWHSWDASWVWTQIVIYTWMLMPLVFLLLPVSFRRAKVRHIHLVRGVMYGAGWVVLSMFVAGALRGVDSMLFGWNGFFPPTSSFTYVVRLERSPWVWGVIAAIFAAIWWSIFAQDYLKLPRAWLVGCLLAFLSFIVAFGLVFLLGGGDALASSMI